MRSGGKGKAAHRLLLVVGRREAVHVALADKRTLPLAMANGSKNLGGKMKSAIVADSCAEWPEVRGAIFGEGKSKLSVLTGRAAVDQTLNYTLVGPPGVVSVGKVGLGWEGDLVEPLKELELLAIGEVDVLGSL